MRKQMDKLGEIMRRQQEMMNETFRMDQMQRGQRQRGENRDEQLGEQNEQGQSGGEQDNKDGQGMSPEDFADALKQLQEGQGKLRSDLQGLMKGLESLGIQPGEGFGEAGDAMGEAETALGEGEGDEAVGQQGRALEALRKGAQDMMQQMQQPCRATKAASEDGGRQAECGPRPARPPARHFGLGLRQQLRENTRRDRRAARPPDPRSDPQAARQFAEPADRARLSGAPAGTEIAATFRR